MGICRFPNVVSQSQERVVSLEGFCKGGMPVGCISLFTLEADQGKDDCQKCL